MQASNPRANKVFVQLGESLSGARGELWQASEGTGWGIIGWYLA
jgi:hypothetical protein